MADMEEGAVPVEYETVFPMHSATLHENSLGQTEATYETILPLPQDIVIQPTPELEDSHQPNAELEDSDHYYY